MQFRLIPPPRNPLARILATIVTALAFIGAFMIGMAALLVLAGIAMVAGLAVWLRIAWIRRRLRKSGAGVTVEKSAKPSRRVIEAEYTVVSSTRDRDEK